MRRDALDEALWRRGTTWRRIAGRGTRIHSAPGTALPGGMEQALTRWVQLGVIEPQEEEQPLAVLRSTRTEVLPGVEADRRGGSSVRALGDALVASAVGGAMGPGRHRSFP